MKVMVRYDDESYDIVEDYCLEYLIRTGNITEFCRTDKWIKIGIDRIREDGLSYDKYQDQERRKAKLTNSGN